MNLIDKLRKEKDGIFLWALEGLQRLISNNYVFTESVDASRIWWMPRKKEIISWHLQ